MSSDSEAVFADVCAIVVSHNGRRWLDAALSSLLAHAGGCDVKAVVVDNGADGAGEWAAGNFPGVSSIRCENRGFGHANNRGLAPTRSRYVLFLNPDTEVISGTIAELVAILDANPEIGLAGARQLGRDGSLAPSIRRFPSPARALAEAIGVERIPLARRALGERELNAAAYDRLTECDWTSGSFMLARRSALEAVGGFDERFFLFSEETDLCWRLKEDGWKVVHLPHMTIRHYEQAHWENARIEAQSAYARLQFARKNLSGPRLYRCSLALRYLLRLGAYSVPGRRASGRRDAARAALDAVLAARPPFGSI